jgi:hypothetical protein
MTMNGESQTPMMLRIIYLLLIKVVNNLSEQQLLLLGNAEIKEELRKWKQIVNGNRMKCVLGNRSASRTETIQRREKMLKRSFQVFPQVQGGKH